MRPITWKEFTDTGYLWWVNRILHTFGLAIVLVENEAGEIVEVYPAQVTFFGFPDEVNEQKLDAFRSSLENPKADVEDRLRAERDRLRNEVCELRGTQEHDYQPIPVEMGENLKWECSKCHHVTRAPVHRYFLPCPG